jgi:hypothetical protein
MSALAVAAVAGGLLLCVPLIADLLGYVRMDHHDMLVWDRMFAGYVVLVAVVVMVAAF